MELLLSLIDWRCKYKQNELLSESDPVRSSNAVQMDSVDDTICAQNPASIFAHNHKSELDSSFILTLTEYFALVASSSPSRSQLMIGFGFPWAEQLSRVLPPSLASTYCGGVAVNEGGAAEKAKVIYIRDNQHLN